MDAIELSDLEEGEILEYEFCSPDNSVSEEKIFGTRKSSLLEPQSEFRKAMCHTDHIKKNNLKHREEICTKKISREKCKFKSKDWLNGDKNKYELDSISSSEEEYRSIENKDVNMYDQGKESEEKLKRYHADHVTYGTVEDIMSEIGETICRKSWCNYRRHKSRDITCNYNVVNSPNHRVLTSHLSDVKKKYGKRKKSDSNSDSEIFQRDLKDDMSRNNKKKKKKRRKKKSFYSHEDENECQSEEKPLIRKVRDFDEVRKNLLEKLKKQKVEEELRKKGENSEIQTFEMSTDGTNCLENPSSGGAGNKEKVKGMENERLVFENEEDEEMDLIKLRSMALASNRRRRNREGIMKNYSSETGECNSIMDKCSSAESKSGLGRNDEDADLDRSELLLRAEALKTALLKKHQRRLNKLMKEKSNPAESYSMNDSPSPQTFPVEEKSRDPEEYNGNGLTSKSALDAFKENLNEEKRSERSSGCAKISEERSNAEEAGAVPCENPKKTNSKARNRKKKRKWNLLLNSVKENDVTEMVEEDDRALRSQLLCDLIKKKSLKDSEKKSVLMDSVQTFANRFPVTGNRKPEVVIKSAPFVQNNMLKKVNVNKTNTVTGAAITTKPEIQRIIVHLGQEDSSEDDSEHHLKQEEEEEEEEEDEEKKERERGIPVADSRTVNKRTDLSTQASYERSVELLLSQARKKIEGEKQRAEENHLAAPEAVYKHLPPSQRLEYMRLKQKIAERERLRQSKKEVPSSSSSSSLAKPLSPSPGNLVNFTETDSESARENGAMLPTEANTAFKNNFLKKGPGKTSFQGNMRKMALPLRVTNLVRAPVNGKPKNSLVFNRVKVNSGGPGGRLVAVEKSSLGNSVLATSNLALISKLKLLLKKIKMEKTIEENYSKEIGKLKNQLSFFEKKKSEQRFKIKKLAEESMKIYKVVQSAAKKKVAGSPGDESAEAKERTSAEADNTKETKPEHKPQTDIKVQNGSGKEGIDCKMGESATPSGVELVEYNSPLQVFKKGCERTERVDPNVIMCQFDLMGICKDEKCAYQHLRFS